jgi:hypothetical protein
MTSPTTIGIDFGYNYSRIATNGIFNNIQQLPHINKLGVPSNLLYENYNFLIERNTKNLNDNKIVIKQIRKLIDKKVPKIDNLQIKDKDKISDRTITIDKNDYSVAVIIKIFIQKLIKHFTVKIDFVSLSVVTIPAYFDDEQKQIIKSSVNSIKKNNLEVILLEEPIAALIYGLQISTKNINDNYLVLTFYEDLLELSIISIDDNIEPFVKKPALFDDQFNLKNRLIRLKDYCDNKFSFDEKEIKKLLYNDEKIINLNDNKQIKKTDLYKDLFDNCKKLLKNVRLDKNNLKKIIIIGNSDFEDKDICEYYFNCEVIFLKNEDAFVNGAVKYAKNYYKKKNNEQMYNLNTFRRSNVQYDIDKKNNFFDKIRNTYSIREIKKNNLNINKLFESDISEKIKENDLKSTESINEIKAHNSKVDDILEKLRENDFKNKESINEIKDHNSKVDDILEKLRENDFKNKESINEIKTHNSKVDDILEKLIENHFKNKESINEIKAHNSKVDDILEKLRENDKEIRDRNIKMEEKFEKILKNVQEINEKLNEKYRDIEEKFMNTTDGFNDQIKEINKKIDLKSKEFENTINSKLNKNNKKIDEKLKNIILEINDKIQNIQEKTNKGFILNNKKETIIAKNLSENNQNYDNNKQNFKTDSKKFKIQK